MVDKGSQKLVGSGQNNNDPHNVKGIEWGSDQFIEKLDLASKQQEEKNEWEDHRRAVMEIQGR